MNAVLLLVAIVLPGPDVSLWTIDKKVDALAEKQKEIVAAQVSMESKLDQVILNQEAAQKKSMQMVAPEAQQQQVLAATKPKYCKYVLDQLTQMGLNAAQISALPFTAAQALALANSIPTMAVEYQQPVAYYTAPTRMYYESNTYEPFTLANTAGIGSNVRKYKRGWGLFGRRKDKLKYCRD